MQKKLDSCNDNKIQSKLLTFTRQYKTCFNETERKFLNKHHEASNFYGLPKIYKSNIIGSSMNITNSKTINISEPNDLKLRPMQVWPSKN